VQTLTRTRSELISVLEIVLCEVRAGPCFSGIQCSGVMTNCSVHDHKLPAYHLIGEKVAQTIPAKRIGRDEDMAGAAIYLASRAGDYVVGQTLIVDGGVSIVHADFC
jgi:NAD(P)-dependent dehydrogenase (short-subunit alcohol dehydrogenase family)